MVVGVFSDQRRKLSLPLSLPLALPLALPLSLPWTVAKVNLNYFRIFVIFTISKFAILFQKSVTPNTTRSLKKVASRPLLRTAKP